MHPKEEEKDGERTRGLDLRGASEDTRFVELRKGETER